MKIKTAIILCAGYGKRLLPLTNNIPKPLLQIKNKSLLDNTIEFIKSIGITRIKINTFYLADQISNFIKKKNYDLKIDVVNDGKKILDTGGGINNLIKFDNEENFITFNPDTLWNSNYIETISNMQNYFFKNKINNLLMVVNKNKSFDKRFKGDFNIKNSNLSKDIKNEYVYTGCQIINKSIFSNINKEIFSMNEVWNQLLTNKKLYGFESLNNFLHVTDIEIFKKIS